MSKLEQLIAELCPNGVEFDTLGSVCEILDNQRKPITKKDRNVGIYPYYGANGIQDYVDDYIFDGTFLLMGEDGSVINKDNSPILTWATGKIWVNNHAHVLSETPRALLRFVYHYLQTIDVSPIVRGTPPKINQQSLRNITIPLPPLPVQQEIVRILDNFTELTAELAAELTARRKQYEYYRDLLLTFGDKVEWKTFNECCILARGDYITKKLANEGNIPVILGGQEPAYYIDKSNHVGKAIVVSRSGASAGFVSYWDEPIFVTDGFIIEPKDDINIRYLFFYYKNLQPALNAMKKGGGVPHITGEDIAKFKVPVPSLEEQECIVSILDRFDALCNDLTSGLPAEIEARQKQYEYYRDKLLSFKEVSA